MDNELLKLEAELSRLRPVKPSAVLEQRIQAQLVAPAAAAMRFPRFRWIVPALAAAAAVIVAAISSQPEKDAAVGPEALRGTFKPVSAQNVLVSSRDEGYVTLANGTPARRVRQTYVDTIVWKNPRTNASVEWTLPREEVQVVPVVYQ